MLRRMPPKPAPIAELMDGLLAVVNRHGNGTPDRHGKGTPFWERPEAMREAFGVAQRSAGGRSLKRDQARFLKRQLSLPVSMISQ